MTGDAPVSSPAYTQTSDSSGHTAPQTKRRRTECHTEQCERRAILTNILSELNTLKQSRNSSFGEYVGNALDMINNPRIEEVTKQRIQLVLSEIISESANEVLARVQNETMYNFESSNGPSTSFDSK